MADDEEPIDMKPEVEEGCRAKCTKELREYEACQERIANDTSGEAHCTGQYLDFWRCIDKCSANAVFSHLK